MEKLDLYKNAQRWESFKENNFKSIPKGIKKEDWKILVDFLKDMELGLNTPKEKKGKRDSGTLLNLSSHNKFFLENFKKPLIKLSKEDLHILEKDIQEGKILKRNGQKFTAFGNYIKDFKVFWHWGKRTNRFKEDITEDVTSKTDKPHWIYMNETDIKRFFNSLSLDYRTYCFFLFDSGMRVTEAMNVKVNDFSDDFTKVTIKEESSKTFERTINLKISCSLIKEFIKEKGLKPNDYFIQIKPFAFNKYLRYHALKMFGDNISNPKSKGNYKDFTMYDIRHNSVCYWYNKYPSQKGLMYRFGWRKSDKIEYYSGFLGVADEIKDSDMILGADKDKLTKMGYEMQELKEKNLEMDKKLKLVSEFLRDIGRFKKGKLKRIENGTSYYETSDF